MTKALKSVEVNAMAVAMDSKISMPDSSKRLLFDRRYGWVIDEWKDPSEEALDGGRGILVLRGALQLKLLKDRTAMPQLVQDGLNDRLHNFMSSLENPKFNHFFLKRNLQTNAISYSSHLHMDSSESQLAVSN